jgi:hypothetical protein
LIHPLLIADAPPRQPTDQDLRLLRPTVSMAAEMETGLG